VPLPVQAKCTLGDETRLIHMAAGVSYAELLDGVRNQFPNAGPFMLKFLDRCAPRRGCTDRQTDAETGGQVPEPVPRPVRPAVRMCRLTRLRLMHARAESLTDEGSNPPEFPRPFFLHRRAD
jgi:hypothetical protein